MIGLWILIYLIGYGFALIEMIRTYMYLMRKKWGEGHEIMVCNCILFFCILAFLSWPLYIITFLLRKDIESKYEKSNKTSNKLHHLTR